MHPFINLQTSVLIPLCIYLSFNSNNYLAEGLTYYVAPTNALGANDLTGYGTRTSPFKTVDYATSKLNGIGGTVILLDGIYMNTGYQNSDIWKTTSTNNAVANTIRVNNKHGISTNPIIIKGDTPTGHVLKGDGANIFQLRTSSYIVLENLNIVGEVLSIPLQEAADKRFDYQRENDNTVYQRVDPALTPEQIEVLTLPVLTGTIYRPSRYTTNGLLVQTCRYVVVKNCTVGYMPGTGLRVQSSDYVDIINNTVHNSSRRGSVGNHGLVVHSLTNIWNSVTISTDDYRMKITGNKVFDNFNEVYSWSELKAFITPHIDEGKGLTIQKSSTIDSDFKFGRILIANNVAFGNGFSGIHTNFAERVDIFFNTVVNNSRTGTGTNTGISVSDSEQCRVVNNIAYSVNSFGGKALSTDSTDLTSDGILFLSNLVVGSIDSIIPSNLQFTSTSDAVKFVNAPSHNYRILGGSSAANLGNSLAQSIVDQDGDGMTRSDPPDLGAFEAFSLASSGGDPHFQTWHGEWFSYHGACDLVLLKSSQFGNSIGLRIHIRTESRNLFSFIRNVAIQIGSDSFEIEGNGTIWEKTASVRHFYNKEQDVNLPISMAGRYNVSKKKGKRFSYDTITYSIILDEMQGIEVLAWKGFLYVSLTANMIACGLQDSIGLMGTWSRAGKLSRGGVRDITDPDEFAQEWQVLSSEPMLFQSRRVPQHPEGCTPPASGSRRRLGEDRNLHNVAKNVCAKVESSRRELCVFDIMATGDLDMAYSPLFQTNDNND